jgi:SAM-dependent methyltransferase
VLQQSRQQIFARMYTRNSWGNIESVSGDGSDLRQTKAIRRKIAALVEELSIRTMLDAPCGDFHWMQHVRLRLDEYIGADVVPDLIEENSRQYGSATRRFVVLDICQDQLPAVDLILCRDCLVHLPLQSAVRAVRNFARSGSRYLLATTYPGLVARNKPLLITGNWRPLDLTLPPFSFPPPLRLINEQTTEPDDFREKSLGLWSLASAKH